MKINVLPFFKPVTDSATGMTGMITHTCHYQDESIRYIFQPSGLNSKTRKPLDRIIIEESRIKNPPPMIEIDVPFEVLGTIVTDKSSGYTGTAIEIIRHTHGCFHVLVQSSDMDNTGNPVDACDFNLIELTGDAIKPLTADEVQKEHKERPSPTSGGLPSQWMPGN